MNGSIVGHSPRTCSVRKITERLPCNDPVMKVSGVVRRLTAIVSGNFLQN